MTIARAQDMVHAIDARAGLEGLHNVRDYPSDFIM